MDEIIKVQNEIIESPSNSVESFQPEKELLVVEDLPHIPFKQLVNSILQRVSIGDVISKIESETEYVVQVPLKFKEAFEKGEVFIAQNKDTLQLIPQLAKYNDKGKYEFVGPMDMIERKAITGAPLQGIADRYQNIAMQQQMAQLSELMEKTHETVRRIEQGQYDDRIGHLIAGKNMICLALSNPDHINEAELNSGREQLQIGCAQIGQTIYRRASEFKKISQSRLTYGRITIRNQRSKWGSCSSKGNLNFNCLLMLAPQEVIDSVVVHELCHRKEMNHSNKFYAEVLRVFPEYWTWDKWLKDNGNMLMLRMTK